jgi:hypothetical protein
MTEPEDRDLEARFAELRAHDASQVPLFDAAPRRPERRAATNPWAWIALAAAAVVLVIGGLRLALPGIPSVAPEAPPTLASWRAPSEVLLETPVRALFGPPMPVGASVVDRFIPQTSVFKGDGP